MADRPRYDPDETGLFRGLEDIQNRFSRGRGDTADPNAMGDKGPTGAEAEEMRRQLIIIGAQYAQTLDIIRDEREALQKLAGSDERIANLLALADKTSVERTANRILDRTEVSQKDASEMVETMKQTTGLLGSLNRVFEVDVGKVALNLDKLVADNRIDTETRRGIATDISQFVTQNLKSREEELNKQDHITMKDLKSFTRQEDLLQRLKDLLKESGTSTEFEENTENIVGVISKLGGATSNIRMATTLDHMNEQLKSSVLTNKELRDTLEQNTKTGKSLQEVFEEFPGKLAKGLNLNTLGSGLLHTILSGLGLGELDEIFHLSEKLMLLLAASPLMATTLGLLAVSIGNTVAAQHLRDEKAKELGLTPQQYQDASITQQERLLSVKGKGFFQMLGDYLQIQSQAEGGEFLPFDVDLDIVNRYRTKRGQAPNTVSKQGMVTPTPLSLPSPPAGPASQTAIPMRGAEPAPPVRFDPSTLWPGLNRSLRIDDHGLDISAFILDRH